MQNLYRKTSVLKDNRRKITRRENTTRGKRCKMERKNI
jgi:hypothetical protein